MPASRFYPTGRALRVLHVTAAAWDLAFQWPLRPALRWNHSWAIARAIEGLEPYAQQRAMVAA